MIKINNLNFYYQDKQVLHDIQLQLEPGSVTGLIGPNGAGKSTLMRCMAGLDNPTHGEVLLNDRPILENPRAAFAQLGYLPDFFGLSEGLTVVQCLAYAGKSRGLSDDELGGAVAETVEFLNLSDKLYRTVGELSRGQKQRVGIGQVIVHKPKFLLLDEPASGLDPEARHELSLLLLKLKSQGMTILVSSHILSELDEYCTHMLVIKEGRIQAYQPLHNVGALLQTVKLQFTRLSDHEIKLIRELENIQSVEWNDQHHILMITLPAGDEVRTKMIRDIVRLDLPLSDVQVVKASLLESYQNSLNTHQKGISK